jgi:hypothetical protein
MSSAAMPYSFILLQTVEFMVFMIGVVSIFCLYTEGRLNLAGMRDVLSRLSARKSSKSAGCANPVKVAGGASFQILVLVDNGRVLD